MRCVFARAQAALSFLFERWTQKPSRCVVAFASVILQQNEIIIVHFHSDGFNGVSIYSADLRCVRFAFVFLFTQRNGSYSHVNAIELKTTWHHIRWRRSVKWSRLNGFRCCSMVSATITFMAASHMKSTNFGFLSRLDCLALTNVSIGVCA